MKTPRTWVLIANGARARLVSAERHQQKLQIIERFELDGDHSPSRELLRDKPSRVFESNGATRHAVEPKSDPHRALKHQFADQIAEALSTSLAQNQFDRLIVVAPAVTLGDLRDTLSAAVKAKIVAEVVSDLTKVPNSEISAHIEDVVPV